MDLRFGEHCLKTRERQLLGPKGPIGLSDRSFDILLALLARPNEVVEKSVLFDAVWPGVVVEENTLQVHVSALRKAVGSDLITTIHGRGYKYAGPEPAEVSQSRKLSSENPARKPMIAVLPFENLSGDPEQLYFADGISSDIIDRLSRFRIISVIGHNSSFALRNSSAVISDARELLKADFVLTGSVRKSDGRIRVAAQLTETANSTICWADHYDRPLVDVFALQDEVAGIVAKTLVGRVEIEIGNRSNAATNQDISSYELVLQGLWHYKKETLEAVAIAQQHFERAISVYPNNAEGHRYLALCHLFSWWSAYDADSLSKAFATASHAVELDPASSGSHQALAISRLWVDGPQAAAASIKKSLELNPNDPDTSTDAGIIAAYNGNVLEARYHAGHAFRLNPIPPLCYPEYRALALFVEGRYAEALPGFEAIPDCAYDNTYVLACHGLLGNGEKAARIMERNARAGRQWDYLAGAMREPFAIPEPRERLLEGLRKAQAI
jgi:TolB-like protein/tetratricopeptide (TPR) repeat protein